MEETSANKNFEKRQILVSFKSSKSLNQIHKTTKYYLVSIRCNKLPNAVNFSEPISTNEGLSSSTFELSLLNFETGTVSSKLTETFGLKI